MCWQQVVSKKITTSDVRTDALRVYMLNVRLKRATTDLLITLNVPQPLGQLHQDADQSTVQCFVAAVEGVNTAAVEQTGITVLQSLLQSFQILDWSLFC
jgi:hypothetical protein